MREFGLTVSTRVGASPHISGVTHASGVSGVIDTVDVSVDVSALASREATGSIVSRVMLVVSGVVSGPQRGAVATVAIVGTQRSVLVSDSLADISVDGVVVSAHGVPRAISHPMSKLTSHPMSKLTCSVCISGSAGAIAIGASDPRPISSAISRGGSDTSVSSWTGMVTPEEKRSEMLSSFLSSFGSCHDHPD
jgi:hypothetical protein